MPPTIGAPEPAAYTAVSPPTPVVVGSASAPAPDHPDAWCPSCGAARPARFCPECGERRVGPEDDRLRHFAAHVVDQLFSLDGTLWRTVRTFVARPGLLTAEYLAGRRTRYTRPLQLFLLVNLGFFLVTGALGSFRFRLAQYSHGQIGTYAFRDTVRVQALVRDKARRAHLPVAEVERRFDAASAAQQSIWLLLAPVLAGALALLYAPRRRPFVHHLVFAVHLLAFLLLALGAAMLALVAAASLADAVGHVLVPVAPGAATALAAATRALLHERVWGPAVLAWVAAYTVRALRRVHGDGWIAAAGRALVLALLLVAFTNLYRDLLFAVSFVTL